MPTITIKSQAELDALPDSFEEYTIIRIEAGTQFDRIILTKDRDNSHAELWESSHAELRGSSHAVLRGSSHAVLWESSHAELRGSSHAVLHASACVHVKSSLSAVTLFAFAVCILIKKCKVKKESKTCTVVEPEPVIGTEGWLETHGIKAAKGIVTLFKRVSKEFKTQEETKNETLWKIGDKLTHPKWNPTEEECGAGKFHACATGYFCDEFREIIGDRYVAIKIAVTDLHAWEGGSCPHKIAFREGTVIFECDRYGNEIKQLVEKA